MAREKDPNSRLASGFENLKHSVGDLLAILRRPRRFMRLLVAIFRVESMTPRRACGLTQFRSASTLHRSGTSTCVAVQESQPFHNPYLQRLGLRQLNPIT